MIDDNSKHLLERIANALDRMAPAEKKINNLDRSEGFVYESKSGLVRPILEINRIPIELLQGIDSQKQTLLDNTISFANDLSANNALLWGARGTGKSSLVKAVHAEVGHPSPVLFFCVFGIGNIKYEIVIIIATNETTLRMETFFLFSSS